MAGAVGNYEDGPEHITRGEFQNVIGSIVNSLDKLDANYQSSHKEIQGLKEKLSPLLLEQEQRKEAVVWDNEVKRGRKILIIGFFTAVASAIVSTAFLVATGLQK